MWRVGLCLMLCVADQEWIGGVSVCVFLNVALLSMHVFVYHVLSMRCVFGFSLLFSKHFQQFSFRYAKYFTIKIVFSDLIVALVRVCSE